MYCGKCGKEIKAGAKFCPYCGAPQQPKASAANINKSAPKPAPKSAPIPETPKQHKEVETTNKPSPRKESKKGFVILIVLLLLALLATVAYFWGWPAIKDGLNEHILSVLNPGVSSSISFPTSSEPIAASSDETLSQPETYTTDTKEIENNLQNAQAKVEDGDYSSAEEFMKVTSDATMAKCESGEIADDDLYLIGLSSTADQSLQFVYYTEEGANTTITIIDYDTDGSILSKMASSYDDKMSLIASSWYNKYGNQGESNSTFTYDEQGNPLSETRNTITYNADGSVEMSDRQVYTYDGNGHILSIETYYEGDSSVINKFTYDSYGNPLTVITQSNGTETISQKNSYVYDVDGHVLEDYASYSDNQEPWLSNKYTYDDAGNMTASISYNADGSVAESKTFEYDSEGHLASCSSYDISGKVSSVDTYNSAGLQLSTITYNTDGSIGSSINYYFAPKDIAMNTWKEPVA